MGKIIVTTGQPYTDIDALACAISYGELLKLMGKDCEVVLPGPLNNSVVKTMTSWNLNFKKESKLKKADYILVDISDPKFFASFVKINQVIEVWDHRKGFAEFWSGYPNVESHIEMVGSCTTLIWEKYKSEGFGDKISKTSANLIYTTTFAHTLNFKSSVTTKRDIDTFNEIKKYSKLPDNWVQKYFEESSLSFIEDPKRAILKDTKGTGESGKSIAIAQLEFWNSKKYLLKYLDLIEKTMSEINNQYWFVTSPSISEGINYLFTKSNKMKSLLTNILNADFKGDIGTTEKLWLRKEILAKITDQS